MHPIRDLRLRVGLTQAGLAELAGTSQPTIAAYESGAKTPNLNTLEAIANAVGFEVTNWHSPWTDRGGHPVRFGRSRTRARIARPADDWSTGGFGGGLHIERDCRLSAPGRMNE